ncbi:MAG: CHAP domain-containing protein [Blastocatellales bacterium]
MPKTGNQLFPFPGRIVKAGEKDRQIVLAIERRLNEVGCGPIAENGDFEAETRNAVKLFQSRSIDSEGHALVIDGRIGSLTWGALFKTASTPPVKKAESRLLKLVVEIAASQIGVREKPPNSNRGPEVDHYLRTVGLNPAAGNFAWCVAFVYFCFDKAASQLKIQNPMIKTAGVLDHWNRAGKKGIPRLVATDAQANPGLIKPGHIFALAVGSKGQGHTGLVSEVLSDGRFKTIEGNSNDGGSREGVGVFARMRKPFEINRGFVDYGDF